MKTLIVATGLFLITGFTFSQKTETYWYDGEHTKPRVIFEYTVGNKTSVSNIKTRDSQTGQLTGYDGNSYGVGQKIPHGTWTEYYEDGSIKAKKQFVNGIETGDETHYFPNGILKEKLFHDDRMIITSHQKYSSNSVLIYEMKWYKTDSLLLVEEFDSITKNKVMEEYHLLQFQFEEYSTIKHGEHIEWFSSGELKSKWTWYLGKEHGTYRVWYKNGQLSEQGDYQYEQYNDSKLVGTWTFWFEDGIKKAEGSYNPNGGFKKYGKWTFWYPNGKVHSEGEYNDWGRESGEWVYYYDTGQKQSHGSFNNSSKRIGKWTFWNEDGSIKAIEEYDNYGNLKR